MVRTWLDLTINPRYERSISGTNSLLSLLKWLLVDLIMCLLSRDYCINASSISSVFVRPSHDRSESEMLGRTPNLLYVGQIQFSTKLKCTSSARNRHGESWTTNFYPFLATQNILFVSKKQFLINTKMFDEKRTKKNAYLTFSNWNCCIFKNEGLLSTFWDCFKYPPLKQKRLKNLGLQFARTRCNVFLHCLVKQWTLLKAELWEAL